MYDRAKNSWLTKNETFFWRNIPMFETLKNLLVEELQLAPDEIKMESELTNDLGINSIELADLVLQCEDKFGIEIEDDDIHRFITIGDVVKYLEEKNQ